MQWQTREEVRKAAGTSDEAALDCSIEHWRQNAEATEREMTEYIKTDNPCGESNCALCSRHVTEGCLACPLRIHIGTKCTAEGACYFNAEVAKREWASTPSPNSWRKWRECAQVMYFTLKAIKYKKDAKDGKREIREGDEVEIGDWSWCFGIDKGTYSRSGGFRRGKVTVISTGLEVLKRCRNCMSGEFSQICDLLVADSEGGLWFTQSRFAHRRPPFPVTHTITIDGEDVEISNVSFESLRRQLLGGRNESFRPNK